MSEIKPEKFEVEVEEEKRLEFLMKGEKEQEANGKKSTYVKTKRRISFDAEDIIAAFAGVIALIFAIAMVAGSIPINKYTIGVATLSGIGAVIAPIIKARNKSKKDT